MDPRVPKAELQCGRAEADSRLRAEPLGGSDCGLDFPPDGAVAVSAKESGVAREDAAPVGRRILNTHASLSCGVEQRVGRAVDQCPSVVSDQRVEEVGLDKALQHADRTARDTDMGGQPGCFHCGQRLDGPSGTHSRFEADGLRIMEEQNLNASQP